MKNNQNLNQALVANNYVPLKKEDYKEASNISMNFRKADIMLVLTINNTVSKEGTKNTIIGKIMIINNIYDINLSSLFKNIEAMNVNKFNIFSISQNDVQEGFNFSNNNNEFIYIELGINAFAEMLQKENFLEYNKNSLYIFRDFNFFEIKNLITKIEDCEVTIGRGSSQKSHILSPLEFRLSTYLMAMFNFDHKLISGLNQFNFLSKYQYLPTKN